MSSDQKLIGAEMILRTAEPMERTKTGDFTVSIGTILLKTTLPLPLDFRNTRYGEGVAVPGGYTEFEAEAFEFAAESFDYAGMDWNPEEFDFGFFMDLYAATGIGEAYAEMYLHGDSERRITVEPRSLFLLFEDGKAINYSHKLLRGDDPWKRLGKS